MGSCSNPHFFSAQNDGPGLAGAFGEASLPEGLGGVQDHLLGALRGLMSTTNYVLRLSANAYILVVFALFFALLGHLLVRYVGRVYAAVGSLYGRAASPVEPTVLMVWELLMLLLSVATSVVVSLLWPLWLPFVLVILGWNTIAWALAAAAAALCALALYAARSRLASPAFWRARYLGAMRAFTKSPYAIADSDDDAETYTEWEEGDEGRTGLNTDAMHNTFVQLHEECLKNAKRHAIERREEEEEK